MEDQLALGEHEDSAPAELTPDLPFIGILVAKKSGYRIVLAIGAAEPQLRTSRFACRQAVADVEYSIEIIQQRLCLMLLDVCLERPLGGFYEIEFGIARHCVLEMFRLAFVQLGPIF